MSLSLLVVEGDGYERGFKHGSTLKSLIVQNVENWKSYIESRHCIDASEFIDNMFTTTSYLSAVESHCPDLLQEVRGIADGSGYDFKTIFCFQLLPEEWTFDKKGVKETAERGDHCSVVGVQTEESTILSQNMDITKFYNGTQTLLHVKTAGVEYFSFTMAGFLALCGLSNRGIAKCCNTLSQICTSVHGVPVTFIVRMALSCNSFAEAKNLLQSVPHATGMNYAIASATEWTSLECSANKVHECKFERNMYHTNHPLGSDDLKCLDPYVSSSSKARLQFLESKLTELPTNCVTENHIKSWLGQSPLCLHEEHNTGFTFGSLVISLSEARKPVLHIAPGPPNQTEWITLEF